MFENIWLELLFLIRELGYPEDTIKEIGILPKKQITLENVTESLIISLEILF
jgi:hypothetical protein